MTASAAHVRDLLREVLDPEIPALTILDMGIVRDVRITGSQVEVDITPTYSGCPAMREIESGIVDVLARHGFMQARVNTVFREAWTTDWMSPEGKEKLRAYGIAPPGQAPRHETPFPLNSLKLSISCPFCGSRRTELRSEFGSTACKSLHYCLGCEQPFEGFKAL
ncbi:MAG: 1,2-phenylacetyl-CoA epoxidase subunit PaaD [Acidobacteriota bacterium]